MSNTIDNQGGSEDDDLGDVNDQICVTESQESINVQENRYSMNNIDSEDFFDSLSHDGNDFQDRYGGVDANAEFDPSAMSPDQLFDSILNSFLSIKENETSTEEVEVLISSPPSFPKRFASISEDKKVCDANAEFSFLKDENSVNLSQMSELADQDEGTLHTDSVDTTKENKLELSFSSPHIINSEGSDDSAGMTLLTQHNIPSSLPAIDLCLANSDVVSDSRWVATLMAPSDESDGHDLTESQTHSMPDSEGSDCLPSGLTSAAVHELNGNPSSEEDFRPLFSHSDSRGGDETYKGSHCLSADAPYQVKNSAEQHSPNVDFVANVDCFSYQTAEVSATYGGTSAASQSQAHLLAEKANLNDVDDNDDDDVDDEDHICAEPKMRANDLHKSGLAWTKLTPHDNQIGDVASLNSALVSDNEVARAIVVNLLDDKISIENLFVTDDLLAFQNESNLKSNEDTYCGLNNEMGILAFRTDAIGNENIVIESGDRLTQLSRSEAIRHIQADDDTNCVHFVEAVEVAGNWRKEQFMHSVQQKNKENLQMQTVDDDTNHEDFLKKSCQQLDESQIFDFKIDDVGCACISPTVINKVTSAELQQYSKNVDFFSNKEVDQVPYDEIVQKVSLNLENNSSSQMIPQQMLQSCCNMKSNILCDTMEVNGTMPIISCVQDKKDNLLLLGSQIECVPGALVHSSDRQDDCHDNTKIPLSPCIIKVDNAPCATVDEHLFENESEIIFGTSQHASCDITTNSVGISSHKANASDFDNNELSLLTIDERAETNALTPVSSGSLLDIHSGLAGTVALPFSPDLNYETPIASKTCERQEATSSAISLNALHNHETPTINNTTSTALVKKNLSPQYVSFETDYADISLPSLAQRHENVGNHSSTRFDILKNTSDNSSVISEDDCPGLSLKRNDDGDDDQLIMQMEHLFGPQEDKIATTIIHNDKVDEKEAILSSFVSINVEVNSILQHNMTLTKDFFPLEYCVEASDPDPDSSGKKNKLSSLDPLHDEFSDGRLQQDFQKVALTNLKDDGQQAVVLLPCSIPTNASELAARNRNDTVNQLSSFDKSKTSSLTQSTVVLNKNVPRDLSGSFLTLSTMCEEKDIDLPVHHIDAYNDLSSSQDEVVSAAFLPVCDGKVFEISPDRLKSVTDRNRDADSSFYDLEVEKAEGDILSILDSFQQGHSVEKVSGFAAVDNSIRDRDWEDVQENLLTLLGSLDENDSPQKFSTINTDVNLKPNMDTFVHSDLQNINHFHVSTDLHDDSKETFRQTQRKNDKMERLSFERPSEIDAALNTENFNLEQIEDDSAQRVQDKESQMSEEASSGENKNKFQVASNIGWKKSFSRFRAAAKSAAISVVQATGPVLKNAAADVSESYMSNASAKKIESNVTLDDDLAADNDCNRLSITLTCDDMNHGSNHSSIQASNFCDKMQLQPSLDLMNSNGVHKPLNDWKDSIVERDANDIAAIKRSQLLGSANDNFKDIEQSFHVHQASPKAEQINEQSNFFSLQVVNVPSTPQVHVYESTLCASLDQDDDYFASNVPSTGLSNDVEVQSTWNCFVNASLMEKDVLIEDAFSASNSTHRMALRPKTCNKEDYSPKTPKNFVVDAIKCKNDCKHSNKKHIGELLNSSSPHSLKFTNKKNEFDFQSEKITVELPVLSEKTTNTEKDCRAQYLTLHSNANFDYRGEKSDNISLSSVSSTISPGSSIKGFLSSGMITPAVTDDAMSVSNSMRPSMGSVQIDSFDDKTPLISKNIERSAKKLVEFISKRLSSTESAHHHAVDSVLRTQWLKQVERTPLASKDVVFDMSNDDTSISPPGSPPVPEPKSFDDKLDAASLEDSRISIVPSTDTVLNEFALWDMLLEVDNSSVSLPSDQRPAFVVLPRSSIHSDAWLNDETECWGGASLASVTSDVSAKIRIKNKLPLFNDSTISSRRRGSLSKRRLNSSFSSFRRSDSFITSASRIRRRPSELDHSSSSLFPFAVSEHEISEHGIDEDLQSIFRLSAHTETNALDEQRAWKRSKSFPDLRLFKSEQSSAVLSRKLHQVSSSQSNSLQVRQCLSSPFPESTKSVSDSPQADLFVTAQSEDHVSLILPISEEDVLVEALFEFSSVQKVSFPFQREPDYVDLDNIVCLRWQQLIACWKHLELSLLLMWRPPSAHFLSLTQVGEGNENDFSSDSRSYATLLSDNFDFNVDPSKFIDSQHEMNNLDGMPSCLKEAAISRLTVFTQMLGCLHKLSDPLRHRIDLSDNCNVEDQLINAAKSMLKDFSMIVEDIYLFVKQTQRLPTNGTSLQTWRMIGIKDRNAVVKKAKRKYSGDVSQVKDILRAQIVFENESALTCGLHHLRAICEHARVLIINKEVSSFGICRIKNSFLSSNSLGTIIPTNLLTGYRHILLNICFDNGLLAELDFQLADMYNLLGESGRTLHHQLTNLEVSFAQPSTCSLLNHVLSKFGVETRKAPKFSAECSSKNGLCNQSDMNSSSDRAKYEDLTCSTQEVDASFFLRLLSHGAEMASRHPRDLATFSCLHELLSFVAQEGRFECLPTAAHESLKSEAALLEYSKACLLRSLNLTIQATSAGMTGWLEYGSSQNFGRSAGRIFGLLQKLASNYAFNGKWDETEDILTAILLRCEQQLPLYHPYTLIAMLDLATVSNIKSDSSFSRNMLFKVAQRVSFYMREMEEECNKRLSKLVSNNGEKLTFHVDHSQHPISHIEGFVYHLRSISAREMLQHYDSLGDIIFLEQTILADSIALLANCLSAVESVVGIQRGNYKAQSLVCWQESLKMYFDIFTALSRREDSDDSMIYATALGIARCLREIGEKDRAFKILASVMKNAENDLSFEMISEVHVLMNTFECLSTHELKKQTSFSDSSRYIPAKYRMLIISNYEEQCSKRLIVAQCLWFLAVLNAECNQTESGRSETLKLLEASSKCLQYALSKIPSFDYCASAEIIVLLREIDGEVRRILDLALPDEPSLMTPV